MTPDLALHQSNKMYSTDVMSSSQLLMKMSGVQQGIYVELHTLFATVLETVAWKNPIHSCGLGCCYLWCERDESDVTRAIDELTSPGRSLADSPSAVICRLCATSTHDDNTDSISFHQVACAPFLPSDRSGDMRSSGRELYSS